MPKYGFIHSIREAIAGKMCQILALSFCFLLGLAMIANNQLEGEATWFYYATFFHHGMKLYADLHLALQPLLILEMDAWMNLFGRKLLVTETPAVLHLLAMCAGLLLLLRESDWPDWQKAIVLAGAFVVWISGSSYRFDDYHITTESFILYSLVLMLLLAKADTARRQLTLTILLGVLCGLATMSRLNDGVALLISEIACLLVLARRRKVVVTVVFVATTALIAILIFKLTGDSFPDYLSNTFTKAVGSKGGVGSFLLDPFLQFRNSFKVHIERRWILPWLAVLIAAGAVAQRYWKRSVGAIVVVQLAIAVVAFASTTHIRRVEMLTGTLTRLLILGLIVASYLVALIMAARFTMGKTGHGGVDWRAQEILILVPLAELASISISAAGEPLSGYYSQLGMLLLLVPVLQPFRKQVSWVNASFLTMLVLLGLTGATAKWHSPYYWNSAHGHPMFTNRQWYHHPVYGPMYLDRDLLKFSESICSKIQQGEPGNSRPELLSLPFSYPNYFCAIPPWHGYVQTFFDISARSTIEKMIGELKTAPPEWIVYQRQMYSMGVLEVVFYHGRRFAQHDLDDLIMQKIASGEWQLVDKQYFGHWDLPDKAKVDTDAWYIIRTRPQDAALEVHH